MEKKEIKKKMVKDCSTCKYARHYMATRWEPEDWDCVAPDSEAAAEWDGKGDCPTWEEYIELPENYQEVD